MNPDMRVARPSIIRAQKSGSNPQEKLQVGPVQRLVAMNNKAVVDMNPVHLRSNDATGFRDPTNFIPSQISFACVISSTVSVAICVDTSGVLIKASNRSTERRR
jgi:hypothetical protein